MMREYLMRESIFHAVRVVRHASLLLIFLLLLSSPRAFAQEDVPLDPAEVEAVIRLVAEWQMAHTSYFPPDFWGMAPLYDGLIDTALVTNDPLYLAPVLRAGERVAYGPGGALSDADSHAVGHAWLRIYLMDPTRHPQILTDFSARFEEILQEHEAGSGWWWSDALYMAPPVLVHLAVAGGDERYLGLAYSEFQATHDALYDEEAHLFYRDASYIGRQTPNGAKVFWSRGNAWVYAGLAEILDEEPDAAHGRDFYLNLFREMSPAILAAQQPDGLWRPSLHDPEQVPMGETSGSALFLYGLAWGVSHGVLDRETYLPAIERGWAGLLTVIQFDGRVQQVQPIGHEPQPFPVTYGEPYGSGAVLGAGAEIMRLLGAEAQADPPALLSRAEALVNDAPALSTLFYYVPLVVVQ